ncbi:MAG TPA: pantoate--beta-alanine ligase [Terriglobales bacterium]|nr:pantoate--beta-alanine ligase [Terriglobales bacterium]
MRLITSIDEFHAACREVRRAGRRLGLVPTMGALHAGHLSLVKAARASCDVVAVSIFVNPLQFGPKEDFSRYPRDLERDRALLNQERVDLVFAPTADEMYGRDTSTYVVVESLSERLCGRSRPGHFRGVTTVVCKLFHIAEPDVAFFGQKDAAQAAIIRKMVRDLNFDIQIVVAPIVREQDGLAMSSRNMYLDPEQRRQAAVLYRALMRLQTLADRGEHRSAELIRAGEEVMREAPGVRLEYLEIVNPDTLAPVADVRGGALVAVAAVVGTTRLIDNLLLTGSGQAQGPDMREGAETGRSS